MSIKFQRKNQSRSFILIVFVIIIILLIFTVPQLLIFRANTIVKYRLDTTTTDTSFVHLIKIANSYLETADMFVIFSLQTDKIRSQLAKKSLEHYLISCKQNKNIPCSLWKDILTQEQLKICDKCAEK